MNEGIVEKTAVMIRVHLSLKGNSNRTSCLFRNIETTISVYYIRLQLSPIVRVLYFCTSILSIKTWIIVKLFSTFDRVFVVCFIAKGF